VVVSETNPFQKVYDALWELADKNKILTSYIKLNNREKYDKWIGAKDNVLTADFPELSLIVDGGLWNLQSTSSHSTFERVYAWAVTTGDFVIADYNCIIWELCRSMIGWDTVLCGLTWKDAQVVRNANQGQLEEGTLRIEQNRNIRGWASIWTLNVEFMIPTELMRVA
jgi:hypothetical protein